MAEWARQNPRCGGGAWEVAVLTFYRGQERELRSQFRAATGQREGYRYFEFSPHLKIELCTVDRFQGHEADVVFISFANTRSTNFLESPNRLNVALTRARYYRVIVGHQHGLARSESEKWEARVARVIAKRSPPHKSRPGPPPPVQKKAPTQSRNDFGSDIEIDITQLHGDAFKKGKR
jgi:hypothetical protein